MKIHRPGRPLIRSFPFLSQHWRGQGAGEIPKLISLLLTQMAENKHLNAVFTHLFEPDGSEIYLKPSSDYLIPGKEANFATVVEAARRRGETAIGYRLKRHGEEAPSCGVLLNPPKSDPLTLAQDDSVIVLAEN